MTFSTLVIGVGYLGKRYCKLAGEEAPGLTRADYDLDWHPAPRRQFAINMTGDLEVEISDGTRHRIGQGDLVYLEDVTGKGHVTRVLTPVTNLFIHVPQNWNMLAWAQGAG